ncbi:AMP-binding protein [Corynebacterium sp. zg-331]|uniref:condensation domain-containing protein n=1 Tax=unclassified Corynebacterium TaxID=2624378 RepID=UPI00128B1498|nr:MULTISPECIES: condensation domain-containing protein [unclassified Corynebacterium]MBC3185625.1 AMP-binding protein [Corynebacterium sp. zg-331]
MTAPAHPTTDSAALPLTGAQRGVFDAQNIDPRSPHYVVGEVLELEGEIDVPTLVAAIEATQREAETLRVRVTRPEGAEEPRQRVSQEIAPVLVRDLRSAPHPRALATARVDAAKTALAESAAAMIDVPLCRYEVLLLGQERTWVIQLYHHLIVDGYSAALLTRRIGEHYTAALAGRAPRAYRGVSLARIVEQDAAYAASPQAEADRAFFRDLLDPPPNLAERERLNAATGTALGSGTTVTTTVRLAAEDRERFVGAARRAGATWVDCLVAVYAAQLWQITGRPEADVCLAMPVMARATAAQRATPHMAVNVLPLPVPVRGRTSMGELVAATAERFSRLREHQRYRGENLPRDLGIPAAGALLHGMGINAKIFDVTFRFGEVTGVLRNVAGGPPEDFGLVVTAAPDGGLDLGLETDPARVPPALARARLEELRALLVRFAAGDAEATVTDFLGGERAATELIDARAATAPAAEASLRRLIDALADSPHPALSAGEETLSGAQLHSRVLETARRLPRGRVIALDLPRGIDLAVMVLAALYAGVPLSYLEPGLPGERRRAILDALGHPWVAGRDPLPEPPEAPGAEPEPAPGDLAYVIFTSGSTGVPKGVEVTRAALEALLAGHLAGLYRRPRCVVAHTASFAFDAALDQLLWLLAGHCVRLYPQRITEDAEAAVAALRRDRVTVFDSTPSLVGALLAAGLGELPDLELVVLGGEELPGPLWDALAAGRVAAVNAYGPTEACVDALMAEVTPGTPVIGSPVAGMRAYALDEYHRVVGDFERGRLFLSGPQLARGYLDEEATGRAFVIRTVDPRRGPERLYDTGDLVRWIPGRGYEYLGRADDQVEINGRRVELGEIEAALRATEGVRAAVAARHGRAGLVGWVVPEPGAWVTPGSVRGSVAAALPAALVPGRVEVVAALPTTVSGKADRRALLDTLTARPEDATHSPAQGALLAACREQVGVAMRPEEDFISQGGDSISALTVATRLRKEGWRVWPKDLLSGTPLGVLAASMRREEAASGAEEAFFQPIGALPETPVARRQRAAAPDRESWAGFVQYAGVPGPPVGAEALAGMAAQLLAAHGALRMILDSAAGELVVPRGALVDPAECVGRVPVGDLAEVAARPGLLDPEAGRLLHLVALEGGGVGLVIHHSAVDALSWRTLRAEVGRLLRGGRLGHRADGWRAEVLAAAAGDYAAELGHWCEVQRAGRPVAAALPARAEATHRTLTIPPAAAAALAEEPEAAMLAALALSVGGYLGVEGHGRTGSQATVGWLTTEYPVAVRPPRGGDPVAAAADALAAARAARREVPGQGAGYGYLAGGDPRGGLHGVGLRSPEVVLNVLPGAGDFRVADHPRRRLTEAMTVNVFLDRSRIEYTADPARFDVEEVHERIVGHLGALRAAAAGGVGPAEVRALEAAHGPIERVLALNPQQEGLLFHALVAREDAYGLAMSIDLESTGGPLEMDRLAAAWEELVRRHPVLRGGFDATTGERPVQFIPRGTGPTFRAIDARDLGPQWRELADHLLEAEFVRHRNLAAPPLVSATAVHHGEDRLRLILGAHHLLTDGWSTGIMLRELVALYSGEALPEPTPPEALVGWIEEHREADARAWRDYLSGAGPATLVAPGTPETASGEERGIEVDVAEHAGALVAAARAAGATPAELLQVAWARVLAELTGASGEVVCGITVSGRPPELPEAAEAIGLFAATLPARIAVSGDPLADLRAHHAARARMGHHTAVSAADIGAAGVFDTIVVYENAPAARPEGRLRVAGTQSRGRTHYPLTVLARPGRDFDVVLAYRPALVAPDTARWAADRLGQALRAFLGRPLPPSTPPRPAAPQSAPAEGSAPTPAPRRAAPGPEAVALIAAEMTELLGTTVGPDTHFAEAGGHSLLAVRLLGRLQRAGLDLGIGDLMAGGSPRGIAARLGAEDASAPTPGALTARTIGGPILWCLPPGDGLATPWEPLARRLSATVRAVTWGGEITHATLGEAAEEAAALIRAEQPRGPYYLLGWSFGGVLAHAVAHALGGPERVAFLGVLDAYPAGALPPAGQDTEAAVAGEPDPGPLIEGLAELGEREAAALRELVAANLTASGRLMAQAAALPWAGKVHLVVATRGAAGGPQSWDPASAWACAGAEVEAFEVDTNHVGLVGPEGWRDVAPLIAHALTAIEEEER